MNGEVHSSFKKFNGSEGVVLDEKNRTIDKNGYYARSI